MRTANHINLDSRLNKILSARASMEHKSVEEYTNQILMMYFSIPTNDLEAKEEKPASQLSAQDRPTKFSRLKAMCGVLPDTGFDYKSLREESINDKYGV